MFQIFINLSSKIQFKSLFHSLGREGPSEILGAFSTLFTELLPRTLREKIVYNSFLVHGLILLGNSGSVSSAYLRDQLHEEFPRTLPFADVRVITRTYVSFWSSIAVVLPNRAKSFFNARRSMP